MIACACGMLVIVSDPPIQPPIQVASSTKSYSLSCPSSIASSVSITCAIPLALIHLKDVFCMNLLIHWASPDSQHQIVPDENTWSSVKAISDSSGVSCLRMDSTGRYILLIVNELSICDAAYPVGLRAAVIFAGQGEIKKIPFFTAVEDIFFLIRRAACSTGGMNGRILFVSAGKRL